MRNPAIVVREATGCAIIEARKALLETSGSVEQAIILCRNTPAQHTRSCPRSNVDSKDTCTCWRGNEPQ